MRKINEGDIDKSRKISLDIISNRIVVTVPLHDFEISKGLIRSYCANPYFKGTLLLDERNNMNL